MDGTLIQISRRRPAARDGRRRLFIRTFGCQMNEYDSEKLARLLQDRYDMTADPQLADLILVNTCSVRDKPEQKLYSVLGEYRELKQARPDLLIGVGGCVAQQEGQGIVDRSSAVDFVFGTHNLSLVPALIDRRVASGTPQIAVDYRDEWEELPAGFAGGSRVSVFVSISRGCNKNCAYCIVPTTRGPEVSRDAEEILKEVRLAVLQGAREVVLLGQTVNSWGLDFKPRRRFTELLALVADIPGVERIRFTSPHPQEVREDFFEAVRNIPQIARHIHMPLQSGSDRILKAMNRNYRVERYLRIIEGLRSAASDIAITTDLIVGFPGESAEDFSATLEVMRTVRYENSYSFMFSPRPGTVAAALEDSVPEEVKLQRLQELQALQLELTSDRLREWEGAEVEVLIEGPTRYDPSRMQGKTSQSFTLNLDEPCAEALPGSVILARVTGSSRFTLKGSVLRVLKPFKAISPAELLGRPGVPAVAAESAP